MSVNLDIPYLTINLLATFQLEDGKGHTCPNVRIVDELAIKEFECEVWIYPKGVYRPHEDSFIFTDVESNHEGHDKKMEDRLFTSEDVPYSDYIRHLRSGIVRGSGRAILGRSEVIECLLSKRYTVS